MWAGTRVLSFLPVSGQVTGMRALTAGPLGPDSQVTEQYVKRHVQFSCERASVGIIAYEERAPVWESYTGKPLQDRPRPKPRSAWVYYITD